MVRRETSKMFRHYSLRKSQTRAQVFSVNCSVICNFAALLTSSVQYGIILPNLVHSGWFWLIMLVILANQKRRNNWFPEGPDIKCFVKGLNPGVHFKSRLSMIVLVILVLNRTVVVDSDGRFDNRCSSHLQSQSELYHVSWWYYTLVTDLIGQLPRDVIGRLSVKPWCYWLWRLVISNWCVSIRLLSQLYSRLLLVKWSVLQSFSRS